MLRWIENALAKVGRGEGERVAELMEQGIARQQAGDLDEAGHLYRQLLEKAPGHPAAHYLLGCALQAQHKHAEAAESYFRAIALDPACAAAHLNLGVLLQMRGDSDGAILHFRAAAAQSPDDPGPHINLGFVHERRRELAQARACYDRALELDPRSIDARFNRSMVLLAEGDYPRGWDDYESRWEASGFARPRYPQPEWDGRALGGATLLLYTEQGFGDAIQFVRYAALAAERGARVVLRCPPELRRLFQDAAGVASVILPHETVPFDCHASLLSLPRLLGTTLDSVPARIPYLRADPSLAAQRRLPYKSPRIGFVWASQSLMPNAGQKSMTVQDLAPFGAVGGARFYSLQTGTAREDRERAPVPLVDLMGDVHDFADTAALLAGLDLTITVDTAVAHLAGAMGRPVWTLLQYAPDWRWYPDARTSKWYPGMRLYRQPRPGAWAAVCDDVASDLREFVAQAVATSPT